MSSNPAQPPPPSAAREPRRSERHDELRRESRSNPTRVDFLETVVSVYELLEPWERRAAAIRIGRGPKLSYRKAFCRIEHYFAAGPQRIFHGGVRVHAHGPNFAVRFFDRVVTAGDAGTGDPREAFLYLKREALLRHWNGRFLVAQLTEASKPGTMRTATSTAGCCSIPRRATESSSKWTLSNISRSLSENGRRLRCQTRATRHSPRVWRSPNVRVRPHAAQHRPGTVRVPGVLALKSTGDFGPGLARVLTGSRLPARAQVPHNQDRRPVRQFEQKCGHTYE